MAEHTTSRPTASARVVAIVAAGVFGIGVVAIDANRSPAVPGEPVDPASAAGSTRATPLPSSGQRERSFTPGSVPSTTTTTAATRVTSSTATQSVLDVAPVGSYHAVEVDPDDPAVGNRDLPETSHEPPPSTTAPPVWATSTRVTSSGLVSTAVGCADGTSPGDLDRFFAARVGPVLGWDYQHVAPLGGGRYLWIFQDAFVDHSGAASSLPQSDFVHNVALVQDGACFTLLHRGSAADPQPFEIGDGRSSTRSTWWWPMGSERSGDRVSVFWVEMVKDPYDPDPPLGLGWHPVRTYLASYDVDTLARTSFGLAPNSGVAPIYGYAVASDESHTYLFGNTFEQNLVREGGFWNVDHSATAIWLARVPRGALGAAPEYRTADGWSPNPADAVPILDRYFVENPMQPRYLAGQWVSATAVDGYWGDQLAIDVADDPWGPWHTIHLAPLLPRGGDPAMNTYHAHLLPLGGGDAGLAVSVSNNARDMRRDAWYSPHRYRPALVWMPTAPTPTTTSTSSTTTSTSTTSTSTTSTSTTSTSTTSTTSTTVAPTTVASSTSTSSTTSTTAAPTTSASTTSTTTTTSTTSTTVAAAETTGTTGVVTLPDG